MSLTRRPFAALAIALASCAASAAAQTAPLSVSGNEARASLELTGGVAVDVTIAFEEVVGLNPQALEVSASLVSPLDATLLARLPGVAPPAAFPLLLRIEPTPQSALSFSGLVSVSLHTHNLVLNPAAPLSLFKAPLGGTFRDITRYEGVGSYRAGGGGGGFSEFLIALDTRAIGSVVAGKFDALDALLAENGGVIRADVLSELQLRLAEARQLYASGDRRGAIGRIQLFSATVKQASGAAIPDVWRAGDSRVNVAGLLRAAADTLAFSLERESNQGQ